MRYNITYKSRIEQFLIARAMALLHSNGEMAVGDLLNGVSIIGSEFHCKILGTTQVGSLHAILPQISGRTWVNDKQIVILCQYVRKSA